jgi:hypothetical protein
VEPGKGSATKNYENMTLRVTGRSASSNELLHIPMARILLPYWLPGILVTGADTGAAGTVDFEPGGVAF